MTKWGFVQKNGQEQLTEWDWCDERGNMLKSDKFNDFYSEASNEGEPRTSYDNIALESYVNATYANADTYSKHSSDDKAGCGPITCSIRRHEWDIPPMVWLFFFHKHWLRYKTDKSPRLKYTIIRYSTLFQIKDLKCTRSSLYLFI